jgi:hypothetical protein
MRLRARLQAGQLLAGERLIRWPEATERRLEPFSESGCAVVVANVIQDIGHIGRMGHGWAHFKRFQMVGRQWRASSLCGRCPL